MSFEIESLEELNRNLMKLEKMESISFGELFTPEFMRKYSQYTDIDSFMDAGNFNATTQEEFDAIPDLEIDLYVAKSTSFNTWEAMMDKACEEYLDNVL